MALQLQWSLDKTVGSAFTIAKGILVAANQDNVSPFAIAACEKFGNTIAMCQETCDKMEALTSKTPQPVAIAFMQAYVGFNASDSASQLSSNQAGVQFLGLAAALATSIEPYQAGRSLHKMLTTSASDKILLPTVRQLNDLLNSLKPRLVESGFMNLVAGWQLFLNIGPDGGYVPDADGIDSLVDAFRQTSRIGEAHNAKVRVTSRSCASWIAAFTKWCLGLQPSIYHEDGVSMLEQVGSQVDLIIPAKPKSVVDATLEKIKVSIQRTIGAPSEFVKGTAGTQWKGLVTIEAYSQYNLWSLGCDTGSARQAMLDAMPFMLWRVSKSIRYTLSGSDNAWWSSMRLAALPGEHAISKTASRYLDSPKEIVLQSLDDSRLEDLPTVAAHCVSLKSSCACKNCKSAQRINSFTLCKILTFIENLASICCDILAMSLYDHVCSPLLHLRGYRKAISYQNNFQDAVRNMFLQSHSSVYVRCYDILYHALTLTIDSVKLPSPAELQGWMISGHNGQVIYPLIFETAKIEQRGFLALNYLPGLIQYEDDTFAEGISGRYYDYQTTEVSVQARDELQVTGPWIRDPHAKLVWLVEPDNQSLTIAPACQQSAPNTHPIGGFSTEYLFDELASIILMEACSHDPNTSLESPARACRYVSPIEPHVNTAPGEDLAVLNVVASAGSEEMRFIAIMNHIEVGSRRGPRIVLRRQACLSCCIDLCRQLDCETLVL